MACKYVPLRLGTVFGQRFLESNASTVEWYRLGKTSAKSRMQVLCRNSGVEVALKDMMNLTLLVLRNGVMGTLGSRCGYVEGRLGDEDEEVVGGWGGKSYELRYYSLLKFGSLAHTPHAPPQHKNNKQQTTTNKQPQARTMEEEDDDRRYDDDEEEEEGERLPPKVEELAQASVPTTLKGVRACLCCGIVKTLDQFLEYG